MMKLAKILAVACCGVATASAHAQADAPLGIPLGGGLLFKPAVGLSYLYDSNLYRQKTNETDATAWVVSPALGLEYLASDNIIRLDYQGQYAGYDTVSSDDFRDSDIFFEARMNQTGRHRVQVNLGRDEGHDPFGTERTENLPITQRDLDKWVITSGRLAYTFGAPSAFLNLTVSGDAQKKDYRNNRAVTQFLERSLFGVGGELKFRFSPRTSLLFDVGHREIEYDAVAIGATTRDGSEQRARVGIQWLASSKMVGRVLAGAFKRDFDAANRKDFTSFDWEASISWRPLSYTEFTLDGSHSTQESYFDQSDFIDVQRIGLNWIHQWGSRFESGLGAAFTRYNFEGFNRSDDIISGLAYGQFEFTRRITARLSLEANDRSSNQSVFDFDRYVTQLRLNVAL